ncbi:MAG: ABC transporter ATP-binding protein [Anaerolineales bacterium]|nr:ABC transporter ATP-binding protein [Anaerolineales bacterium]
MNTSLTRTWEASMRLEVKNIIAGYQQGIDILNKLDLVVEPGSVTIIIGPNGAGKSTLLKTIYGFLKPRVGSIHFGTNGDISKKFPHEIKHLGISYIPQEFNVFPQLTIEENLKMGAWIFRNEKNKVVQQLEHTYAIFPALKQFRKSRANTLSGGQMRMLSIAKEVMTSPKLMLVDEPSAGLAPKIAAEAYEFLMQTQEALSAAILLVDHNMETAISLADYVYILNMGRIREEGPKEEFDVDRIRNIIQECLLGE